MPIRKRRPAPHPARAVRDLFVQPTAAFYGQAALYWCGRELEIQKFLGILAFDRSRLRLRLHQGSLCIEGDDLTILALERDRILLQGRICRIEYSYD